MSGERYFLPKRAPNTVRSVRRPSAVVSMSFAKPTDVLHVIAQPASGACFGFVETFAVPDGFGAGSTLRRRGFRVEGWQRRRPAGLAEGSPATTSAAPFRRAVIISWALSRSTGLGVLRPQHPAAINRLAHGLVDGVHQRVGRHEPGRGQRRRDALGGRAR